MMPIRTIIVDDEPLAVAELATLLKLHPEIEVSATADRVESAVPAIRELAPDLVFLDINMPGKNGFELLEELDSAPLVIFVTAYDEYAIRAFEVNALDYILKPVNPQRLAEAVEKIKKQLASPEIPVRLPLDKRIFIKDGEQCFFIEIGEIFLIESVGNYARIHFQDKKPMLHKSLNQLEEKLPAEFFFRANRQFIFNLRFVRNIVPFFNNTLQVELQNGVKIEMSQRQSIQFRQTAGI